MVCDICGLTDEYWLVGRIFMAISVAGVVYVDPSVYNKRTLPRYLYTFVYEKRPVRGPGLRPLLFKEFSQASPRRAF